MVVVLVPVAVGPEVEALVVVSVVSRGGLVDLVVVLPSIVVVDFFVVGWLVVVELLVEGALLVIVLMGLAGVVEFEAVAALVWVDCSAATVDSACTVDVTLLW